MTKTNSDLGELVTASADLVTGSIGFGEGPEADAISLVCSAIVVLAGNPKASMEDVLSFRDDDPAEVREWWGWDLLTANTTDSPAPGGRHGQPSRSLDSGTRQLSAHSASHPEGAHRPAWPASRRSDD